MPCKISGGGFQHLPLLAVNGKQGWVFWWHVQDRNSKLTSPRKSCGVSSLPTYWNKQRGWNLTSAFFPWLSLSVMTFPYVCLCVHICENIYQLNYCILRHLRCVNRTEEEPLPYADHTKQSFQGSRYNNVQNMSNDFSSPPEHDRKTIYTPSNPTACWTEISHNCNRPAW